MLTLWYWSFFLHDASYGTPLITAGVLTRTVDIEHSLYIHINNSLLVWVVTLWFRIPEVILGTSYAAPPSISLGVSNETVDNK